MEESVGESPDGQPLGSPGDSVNATLHSILRSLSLLREDTSILNSASEPGPCIGMDESENLLSAPSTTSGDIIPTPVRSARKRGRDDTKSSSDIVGGQSVEGCEAVRGPKRRLVEAGFQTSGDDEADEERVDGLAGLELGGGVDSDPEENTAEIRPVSIPNISTDTPIQAKQAETSEEKDESDEDSDDDQRSGDYESDPDSDDEDNTDEEPRGTGYKPKLMLGEKFYQITKTLRTALVPETLPKSTREEYLDLFYTLNKKYQQVLAIGKKKPKKKHSHPVDSKEMEDLMRRPFKASNPSRVIHEDVHPWMPSSNTRVKNGGLLLRAWDEMSECQIRDNQVGFLSGASYFRLITRKQRSRALKFHANWGNRIKTPFNSATTSPTEIYNVRIPAFERRQERKKIRPNSKLTVINANARLAAKLPILRMKHELDYYNVVTPYGDQRNYKNSFYENEYLLPFRISPEEIVGTWLWEDILSWMKTNEANFGDWYERVAVLAFKKHEKARLSGEKADHGSGCTCCGH